MTKGYKHDPVSAISEQDATGEIAEIFADIRATMQIPHLTSIWRILAGFPGALNVTWEATKPIFESGQADAALEKMLKTVQLPELSVDAIPKAGLNNTDVLQIKGIIDVYNRSTSLNFLALSAFAYPPSDNYTAYASVKTSSKLPDLPALLTEKDMAPATWSLLHKLNQFGATPDEPGLATIWRHLAHWPDLLNIIHAALTPLQRQGIIDQGKQHMLAFAANEGAHLAHLLPPDINLPRSIQGIVTNYVKHSGLVVRMVFIGHVLGEWLGSWR